MSDLTRTEIITLAGKAGFSVVLPEEAGDMLGGIYIGDQNVFNNFVEFINLVKETK